VIAIATVGILAESWMAPMPLDLPVAAGEGLVTPTSVTGGLARHPLYGLIARLAQPVVLVEFPFGDTAYEFQAVFYAGQHRRPILNGYSGFFPRSYRRLASIVGPAPTDLGRAEAALRESGATHVLVHEGAFEDTRGRELSDWMRALGAVPVAEHGSDRLFALPPE
jgi:hypothetical protein